MAQYNPRCHVVSHFVPSFSPVYRRTPQRLAPFTGRRCADTLGLTATTLFKEREERATDSPTTMSVHHRQPTLGRLMIPPNLGLQQPGQTAMFSPSLPTSIQQGFHPPFVGHIPGNVMTPVQAEFMPMPMPAAGRPINHRARASIAQLAAVGYLLQWASLSLPSYLGNSHKASHRC
jgi:hypothetical protein